MRRIARFEDREEQPVDDEVLNRLAVEFLMSKLNDAEDREILWLWAVEDLTFDEIGAIIGMKYRTPPRKLTGSCIRYHKEKLVALLAIYREDLGL